MAAFAVSASPPARTLLLLAGSLAMGAGHCQTPLENRLTGDVGLSVLATQASAPEQSRRTRWLPYAYADFGRAFIREDTFGVKLSPLGWGWAELAGRFSTESSDNTGPRFPRRSNPRPVGLGTFQETPWGGIFLNAFVDTVSRGSLLEASYAAELKLGPVTIYPQAGAGRRSARYTDHVYGVSQADAAMAGVAAYRPYRPGASTVPFIGLAGELPLGPDWVLVAHAQRDAFDRAISASPRVDVSARSSLMVAVAYRFR